MDNEEKSATELLNGVAAQLAEIRRAKHYGLWRGEAMPHLDGALAKMQPFNDYCDVWIYTGDGGYVMATARFGEWAIDRLVERKKPDEILAAFDAEVARNVGDYTEVSPVFGVETDVYCELGDGIAIVPESVDVPEAFLHRLPIGRGQLPTGTAMLCQVFTVSPAFERRSTEDRACSGTSVTSPQSFERDAVRTRVRLACVLASKGPVELPLIVLQPAHDALFVSSEGSQSARPYAARPLVSFPVEAAAVRRNYRALATFREIDSLARSIDRLGRSRLAVSPVDRALELGIAAEIALMHGPGEGNAEITHKIGTRAAWLLGHDLDERETIFTDMKKLYAARSQAVHSGVLSSKSNVDLDAADRLVVRVLRAILDRGIFPKWTRLTMGGQDAGTETAAS